MKADIFSVQNLKGELFVGKRYASYQQFAAERETLALWSRSVDAAGTADTKGGAGVGAGAGASVTIKRASVPELETVRRFTTSIEHVVDRSERPVLVVTPLMEDTLLDAAFDVEVFDSAVEALDVVLRFLHSMGRVHGDLSPSNILVSASTSAIGTRTVRINDFGASVRTGEFLTQKTDHFAPISFSPALQVSVFVAIAHIRAIISSPDSFR
jgi:hypothetical protein